MNTTTTSDSARVTQEVQLLDPGLLARVGFTDHAIQRFAQRAGLDVDHRATVEPIIRDLLTQEGLLACDPPHWGRTRNPGDLHLQAGQWMLFICRHDLRRPGHYSVVTVVNGPGHNTWARALRHGYIATPMPMRIAFPTQTRVRLIDSIKLAARRRRDRSVGLMRTIIALHRQRVTDAKAADSVAVSAYEATVGEHRDRRHAAREAHLWRYGCARSTRQRE